MIRLSFWCFVAASLLSVSLDPEISAQSTKDSPATTASFQWVMQNSGTTASLRGIDSVDGKVAWASGSEGTVLRTSDGGTHWTRCATPDGDKDGATLDFRGIQAWDARTAIVMSSGLGDKSRLYKTTDGCSTWKLVFRNPDKDGFWDALYFENIGRGWLLGDPVNNEFTLFTTTDEGKSWIRQHNNGLNVAPGTQGAFAASNSSLLAVFGFVVFGSGGSGGAFIRSLSQVSICLDDCAREQLNLDGRKNVWRSQSIPLGERTDASGVFSLGARAETVGRPLGVQTLVAVGGDYSKPDESASTAAYSPSGGLHWVASITPPHGYRCSVQWNENLKAWITVGTNGSDISYDDGKTWQPVDNGNWNALSFPFVVGPHGRIAKLSVTNSR